MALQEIGSVEGNPFYCLCSLRTMCFCKALCAQTAAEQMMTMMTMMATYYCVLLNMLCFSGTASCELEECPSFAYICP